MKANIDVLLNKTQTIERCVARAREEYAVNPSTFAVDHTRQDAAVLNVLRACEAAIDLTQHIISSESLGVAQGARDAFGILQRENIIDATLTNDLQSMVGFRNIAVHDYQVLNIDKVVVVLNERLDDLLQFSHAILRHYAKHLQNLQ